MSVRRRGGEEKRKNKRERKKEKSKNCELGVFGGTSDFNIYRGYLIFIVLVLPFETRNFVLRVQLQQYFL